VGYKIFRISLINSVDPGRNTVAFPSKTLSLSISTFATSAPSPSKTVLLSLSTFASS